MMDIAEPTCSVVLRGGGSLVACRPIFTPDSRYVLCGSGHSVKVLSVTSGECVRTLWGHSGSVTAIIINPANQFQALTSSLDRTVVRWDIQDGVLLARYQFVAPLRAIYPAGRKDSPHVFYSVISIDAKHDHLAEFVLPKRATQGELIKSRVVLRNVAPCQSHSAVGCQGAYIASIKLRTLRVLEVETKQITELRWDGRERMTCVACHPSEFCIATGVSDGRIVLWRSFLSSMNAKAVKTVIHWHALAVGAMTFTCEGSYLLSAGQECVLVKWQTSSKQRDTLPRLGAPVCQLAVSPDNQLYAACHSDNGIQLISNNFKVVQIYQGLVQGHRGSSLGAVEREPRGPEGPLTVGLQHDPRTGALVTNGRPGQLQFFNAERDQQLFTLDITSENYVSGESERRPLVHTAVRYAALDAVGDWLVTLEHRDDHGATSPDMRLKFWRHCVEAKTYELNTTVSLPHSKRVEAVRFRPSLSCDASCDVIATPDTDDTAPMVVTTSVDGTFKLWTLVDDTDIYRSNRRWDNAGCGSYREGSTPGPADFSEDGTLLAVGFDDVITLWSPAAVALEHAVSLGGPGFVIRLLVFGRRNASHILYAATSEKVYAWNLLAGAVQFVLPCRVTTIIADPSSNHIAAFTDDKQLLVLDGRSCKTLYSHSTVAPDTILSAIFVPSAQPGLGAAAWLGKNRLYFMTVAQELLTLVDSEDSNKMEEDRSQQQQALPRTTFGALVAEKKRVDAKDQSVDDWSDLATRPDLQFFHEIVGTPLHVLPPISSLCQQFLSTLLIANKPDRSKDGQDGDDESDDSSDDDRHAKKNSEELEDMET